MQRAKIYELVLFNNISFNYFEVRLALSLSSFFLKVFPSRRLSATFDIQTDLKTKHLEANSEAYSETCQTSKREVFAQIGNGF